MYTTTIFPYEIVHVRDSGLEVGCIIMCHNVSAACTKRGLTIIILPSTCNNNIKYNDADERLCAIRFNKHRHLHRFHVHKTIRHYNNKYMCIL